MQLPPRDGQSAGHPSNREFDEFMDWLSEDSRQVSQQSETLPPAGKDLDAAEEAVAMPAIDPSDRLGAPYGALPRRRREPVVANSHAGSRIDWDAAAPRSSGGYVIAMAAALGLAIGAGLWLFAGSLAGGDTDAAIEGRASSDQSAAGQAGTVVANATPAVEPQKPVTADRDSRVPQEQLSQVVPLESVTPPSRVIQMKPGGGEERLVPVIPNALPDAGGNGGLGAVETTGAAAPAAASATPALPEPAPAPVSDPAPVAESTAIPMETVAAGDESAFPSSGGVGARVETAVNMRMEPSTDSDVIAVIREGATVDLLGCDQWCEVEADGQRGWIFSTFLDPQAVAQAAR